MKKDLFDQIAKYYGLFYLYQKRKYSNLLDRICDELELFLYRDMIDIGCGTGAFCAELNKRGYRVTGIDSSPKMIEVARKKQKAGDVKFIKADILDGLPFKDNSFDVAVTSFVAHGLPSEERKILYREMRRITKHMIIIYDYNGKRSALIDIIERLEGGDYFNFIKNAGAEMQECFTDVKVIDMYGHASCYVIRL